MPISDQMLRRIAEAVRLGDEDPEAGQDAFAELWDDVGPAGDPVLRSTIAHALGQLHEDPQLRLRWELRALDASALITDDDAADPLLDGSAKRLPPALHLSVAEAYHELGEPWDARDHLELGLAALEDVDPSDGDAMMIRLGLERLSDRLDAGDVGSG